MATSVYHPKEGQAQNSRAAFSPWNSAFKPIPRPRQLGDRVEIGLLVNAQASSPLAVGEGIGARPGRGSLAKRTPLGARDLRSGRRRGLASLRRYRPGGGSLFFRSSKVTALAPCALAAARLWAVDAGKRRRSQVNGVAEGSGGVPAWWAGLRRRSGNRQKSSDQPDCFSSGASRARPPAAGREKPKAAGWPFSRALQMGDDRRCSCSSSATVAMRGSSRRGKTRGFVETLVRSASIGAGKRPRTRPGRRSTRPPRSSAERRGCASEMSLSL